jgi:hypothetical protein
MLVVPGFDGSGPDRPFLSQRECENAEVEEWTARLVAAIAC